MRLRYVCGPSSSAMKRSTVSLRGRVPGQHQVADQQAAPGDAVAVEHEVADLAVHLPHGGLG